MRARLAALLGCIALVAAACGSGGGSPSVPTVAPAKQYKLDWQAPVGVAKPGEVTLKFAIVQPDGSRTAEVSDEDAAFMSEAGRVVIQG